ncbi:MAG TPA: CDP-diacylglycerol--glycerol-3-phosphate 3-phosphatidyltransferase [Candidatus Limnocylindrales bacterium]|nr:CDP-diacylglycerol--glycerol-3-phosphate 3-phosphatidyltransferase [Candidatus Limnocylindrales bacterium]
MPHDGSDAQDGSELFRQLPNILTLLRILAIPLLVWLLSYPGPRESVAAMGVFFLASMTDFLDGWIARRYGLVTPLGKLLDPLADKLLVVSALVMLGVLERDPGVPGWLLVVIIGRELSVTGLRSIAAVEGIVMGAEVTGKTKMLLQTLGVHFLIVHYRYLGVSFHDVGLTLLVLSAVVGTWSAVDYHLQVFARLRLRPARWG